ncbi:MAG TPA: sigma-70 family RNA polymerase sigma factor [Acholeplasma sp.]|nr:sigma-70 family RNA polymerase sigma factor [Acholeplasma sp.]
MFDNKKLSRAMLSLKAGDESVFEYIYDQTNRLVYYQIYSIVADHGLTEEVMQDVYMKIIDKIHTYEDKSYPKAWIMMIARNESLNLVKKRNRELIISDEKISFISADEKSETPLIDTAHEVLDEQSFLIVMYCVVENKTRREVGDIFNLSTSGVTFKLNEALTKLRGYLEGGANNES